MLPPLLPPVPPWPVPPAPSVDEHEEGFKAQVSLLTGLALALVEAWHAKIAIEIREVFFSSFFMIVPVYVVVRTYSTTLTEILLLQ